MSTYIQYFIAEMGGGGVFSPNFTTYIMVGIAYGVASAHVVLNLDAKIVELSADKKS